METLTLEKRYTVQEYLTREEASTIKHEFYNGEIIPMSGASFIHNTIAVNIMTALKTVLKTKERKYYVANSDTKIQIESLNHFVYPDAVVVSGKPIYYQQRADIITNPLLIVEVLSSSTEKHDRSLKFDEYCTLPSFQQYVLIAQQQPYVSTFYKESEDLWRRTNVQGADQSIYLASLDITLALTDIYDGVEDLKD